MTFNRCLHILGEFGIDSCSRVLGQQSDTFRDRTARRNWRMDHRDRQLATLDHNFRTRAHPSQQPREVADRVRFRDVDYVVSHGTIIALFTGVQILLAKVDCGAGKRPAYAEDRAEL
jgi:hypothetical protein